MVAMKWKTSRRFVVIVVLAVLLLLAVTSAFAMSTYHLSWYAVSGGGGHVSGGHFTMDGTLGQPVVGNSSGGSYGLCSGYQCGAGPSWYSYVPVVNKGG